MTSQTYERVAEGIAQRGPSSFTARTWRGGPSRTFTGKGAKADAIAWRRDAMSKRDKGEPVVRKASRSTVGEELDLWLAHVAETRDRGTWAIYDRKARTMVRPRLGNAVVQDLTKSDVEAFAARLGREGYADRSIAKAVWIVKSVLSFAHEHGRLSHTRALAAKVGRSVIPGPVDAADLGDCAAVIGELPERARIVAQLALGAGLRISEAFGLTPEDVDHEARTITVHRQWLTTHWGPTKTHAERTVPVSASLLLAIRAHVARYGVSTEGTIASRADGGAYTSWRWSDQWQAACKRAGVSLSGVHQFRHAYGSHLVASGESIVNVSRWMGHRDVATTMRYYLHPDAAARPSVDLLETSAAAASARPARTAGRASRTNRALKAV